MSLEPFIDNSLGIFILFLGKWKFLYLCSLHPFVCEIVPLPAKRCQRDMVRVLGFVVTDDFLKLLCHQKDWNRTLENIEHTVTGGKTLEQKVLFDTTPDVLRTIRREQRVASLFSSSANGSSCICVPCTLLCAKLFPFPLKGVKEIW
ncbi:hypothetical protein CDAR_177101 [Caerostris darwini]|uniref:Uncharacterized protein n=1 Tax=Caerostris darwini TaxID=1538125 RepID=A0AAV4UBE7_9ARAC|nr:hypothetical protein CDAR_177101 [Caerostris darwini]